MEDSDKTREELVKELSEARRRIAETEESETERKQLEEKLRESEAALTEAQRIAHIGSWDWYPQTEELRWSDETYHILGLCPGEAIPQYEIFLGAVHPDDRGLIEQAVDDALRNRNPFSIEHRIIKSDGSARIVHSQGEVIFDVTGKPFRMIGTLQDLTEQKVVEKAWQLFRSLINQASDSILVADPETGRILDANLTACSKLGYTTMELLEKKIQDINEFVSDNSTWPAFVEEVKRNGAVILEGRHTRKDGSTFPVEVDVKYITQAEGNYLLAVVRDITQRKQAEEAVRKSEKKLRDITSSLGEGIYVLNESGSITFMNEEAERLFGWTHDELRDKVAHAIIHNQKADGTPLPPEDCPMHHVIKTGKRFVSTEEVFTRKDGTVFPSSVITTPIVEEGKVVASVTAFRDITERRRLENELLNVQKLESLGYLAGGIAHDFNNLLQAILGNISLAKLYCRPGGKIHKRLIEAENASLQATQLSYRLLTFSKGGDPYMKITSIAGLLADAMKFTLSGSNVICEFDIPADCHMVEVDEGQIIQVIHNLAMNAREAMPEGGVVKVGARNVQGGEREDLPLKERGYLRISIEDNGVGIPEENLAHIFDPYFTTKGQGSRKGSGLGLAICHSIIKKHAGLITVKSEIGTGTTFDVYLPAHETTACGDEASGDTQVNKRILLLDDEEAVRTISGEILKHLGYEVVFASEGTEAILLYRQFLEAGKGFCAVILDLTIPGGIGGERVMEKVLEIDPSAKGIVSSGYADDPIIKQFREWGFAGALAKPYTIEQMKKVLREIAC